MRLLVKGFLEGSLLVCPVLAVNLIVDLRLVVLFMPFSLLLHGLLEKDVLLSILVHVLEEVDTSLVLTTPLLLACVPLLLVLFLSKGLKMALLCCLVSLDVLVMALQLLDFVAAGQTLSSFEVFNSLLTRKGGRQQLLVSFEFHLSGLLSQLLLSSVVSDELQVALTV